MFFLKLDFFPHLENYRHLFRICYPLGLFWRRDGGGTIVTLVLMTLRHQKGLEGSRTGLGIRSKNGPRKLNRKVEMAEGTALSIY